MCARASLLVAGFCVALMMLAGCVSHNHAPVRDLEKPRKITWGHHRVVQGDTLYSIAWRYGWDYQALARANRISKPYLLKPGQVIYLNRRSSERGKSSANKKVVARKPAEKKGKVAKPKPTGDVVKRKMNWSWPASGSLVGRFSRWGENKGIDIAVKGNNAVRSAADGIVVYAGNGLIGYGNLIIIKHNDTYLSAYANNRTILVKEQKSVKVGEKIAEIGGNGARKSSLHFEIRKNGKPVDPLIYLPKSKG